MKKRGIGEREDILTGLDILILDCLLNESPLGIMEIVSRTKGAHNNIKNRLTNLTKYGLINKFPVKKSRKINVSLKEDKKQFIKTLLEIFKK